MSSLIILVSVIAVISIQQESIFASKACSSSCGQIHNITSPFRLTTDPLSCGDLRYNLSCENNQTVLYLHDLLRRKVTQRYHVKAINYDNYTIRVADPSIQKDDHCSAPAYTLFPDEGFRDDNDVAIYEPTIPFGAWESVFGINEKQLIKPVILFNCQSPVSNSSYIDASPCTFNGTSSLEMSRPFYSYYYVLEGELSSSALNPFCRIELTTLISIDRSPTNSSGIINALTYGFELSWIQSFDKTGSHTCRVDAKYPHKVYCDSPCEFLRETGTTHCRIPFEILDYLKWYFIHLGTYKYVVGLLAPRTIIGVSFVIALCIYKWRRRHLSTYDSIEEFLQRHSDLMPVRYSYRDIRKMTKGLKEKLGQGGFGSVYKGKLCSGAYVAIKMLSNSKANGEDFINEVATIGRIHHLNVVRLIGFCVEGSRRALVYEFMCNGSLDKFIFSKEGTHESLSFEKIIDISLGIARGIEYLHRGCDMQILHFDIKPHNILLDESFVPKVSDFGLARMCPIDDSMVCLTAARGTIGYIAPELFYKNIGGVSHKADVYSFGMLLMEMANRSKNVNASAENSSQAYFPTWIYDQFSQGKDIEKEDVTEEESIAIKKMIIVALWCIQLKPCDRPSMNKVVEMLEEELECLKIPPKLCLYPQELEQEIDDHNGSDSSEPLSSSPSPGQYSREIRFFSNSY